jgi:hypothetical protein
MLAIASVATILAARDHRGIWAAIKRDDVVGESTTASGERGSPSNN